MHVRKAAITEDHGMAFEDKEAELGLLLTRMQNEPKDRHEIYLQIRQTLNELKAYGMPLPADLVQFERDLEAEFEAEKVDSETSARRARLEGVMSRRGRPR
jgi:hypothetical protein